MLDTELRGCARFQRLVSVSVLELGWSELTEVGMAAFPVEAGLDPSTNLACCLRSHRPDSSGVGSVFNIATNDSAVTLSQQTSAS